MFEILLSFLSIIMPIDNTQIAEVPGVNKELVAQNIYTKVKIVPYQISGTGIKKIICGFPPKFVQIRITHAHEMYFGETDFTTTHSEGLFYNGTDDIDTNSTVGNFECLSGLFTIGRKLYDGFEIDVYSWSGSTQIYFTCFN